MNEHPILFSAPMVRAILEGKKTQTRRVIKPQPKCPSLLFYVDDREWRDGDGTHLKCPYGVPGDQLWVREAWARSQRLDRLPPRKLEFLTANPDFPKSTIYYRADSCDGINPLRGKWRPSIHMPRWASRLTLEVAGVRVERLQNITEEDVFAEGCNLHHPPDPNVLPTPEEYGSWHIPLFVNLWNSLNAKRGFGWETNPWVWVVTFKEIRQ